MKPAASILCAIAALCYATASEDGVIDVGDVRQLFTDTSRIEPRSGVLTEDTREVPYKPSDLSRALGGRVIRLRFFMKAAHLFAFRFC
jgi:hypothetical protein